MSKVLLLLLLSSYAFALEISMDSAQYEHQRYSILTLHDNAKFICQEKKDNRAVIKEIICAFSKKPSSLVPQLENDFFKVDTFIKDKNYFISVKPLQKIKLVADIFDLSHVKSVYSVDVSIAKRWKIIGYKTKLPLINEKPRPDKSINFPFFMDNDMLPYVASLDLKGNPVEIQEIGDVKLYLTVKKLFKEEKYERSKEIVDDILSEYPNTLFRAELLYYKIKIYNHFKDYDNVVLGSKDFLREYSASDNVAEVLSLMAKAYSLTGQKGNADYFFDRLFSEHQKSIYAQWGYIYKGEMLEAGGGLTPALKFYKKALYETSDINVAASAAYKLASATFDTSMKKSISYIDKIIQADPSFFWKHYKEADNLMQKYADSEEYLSAAKIAQALCDAIDPTYDEYEVLLSYTGLWLAKTSKKKEALKALNAYIKAFPDGDYINEVELAKDGLFFEEDDANTTTKLKQYNALIETYAGDTIGERAIYEKEKLLLKEDKFLELLEFKDSLLSLDKDIYTDVDSLIKASAKGVMQASLEKKECHQVLVVSSEYNITLSAKWDDGIYECAMKGGDYKLAKSMASKNFKSQDIDERKKWLYRYIKVDFATGNYTEMISASEELIALIEKSQEKKYLEVYRYLFDTYQRLEQDDNMLKSMLKLEEVFGLDYKDIERYFAVMSLGESRKDNTIIIKYGEKVLQIQKDSDSHAQSPYVEFTLYSAYVDQENLHKALQTIEVLDSIQLTPEQKARQEYLRGSVLRKLWRDSEAKMAFDAAIKADPSSVWAKLAKSAKDI